MYTLNKYNSHFHGNSVKNSKAAILIVPWVITVETDSPCSVDANVTETSWSSRRSFPSALGTLKSLSVSVFGLIPQNVKHSSSKRPSENTNSLEKSIAKTPKTYCNIYTPW